MLATLTVKVPLETGRILDAKLLTLRKMHEEEMKKLERATQSALIKGATSGDSKVASRAQQDRAKLLERGRKITMANLVRVIVDAGLRGLQDDRAALSLLADHGTLRGRPRGA